MNGITKSTKVCFIDVETTGLKARQNGIIQIAGILEDLESDRFEEFTFDVRPFPTDTIEESALEVNKKTREEILAYPHPSKIYNLLCTTLSGWVSQYDKKDKLIMLGYNVQFDANFLREFFKKNNDKYFGSWFWNPPIDVMVLAAAHYMRNRADADLANFKLATVCDDLFHDINPDDFHDAMFDVKMTRKVFMELYWNPLKARGKL